MALTTYESLLSLVTFHGQRREDRTGTGTRSIFGAQLRLDLAEGFPLVTTKSIHIPSVVHELLWFLSGSTNIAYLQINGVRIWNEWADEYGDLGPVYGSQWRSFPRPDGGTVDQITQTLELLRRDPYTRRAVISAWNPGELEEMALPPCHVLFQFYVHDGKLSCQLYQRSADVFLGVPFNIASYSLLTHMFADQLGLKVGEFIWTGGDVHLYENHVEQATEQLDRQPRRKPWLSLNHRDSIFDYVADDVIFLGYRPHPAIKAPVAV